MAVCLMRLGVDLGVGVLRHWLHLGVLGRCGKEVGACLILLVAHERHRVPGSILLLLLLLLVRVLLLMLMLLMELRLLKLRRLMLLLVLRISRLRGHLLIAMAIIGLPVARRLLAPIVHGRICHSSACCRWPLPLQLISSTGLLISQSSDRYGSHRWFESSPGSMARSWMGRQRTETRSTSRQSRTGRDKLQRTSKLKMPIPGQMRLPGSWKPRPPRAPAGPCLCTLSSEPWSASCPRSRGSLGTGTWNLEFGSGSRQKANPGAPLTLPMTVRMSLQI